MTTKTDSFTVTENPLSTSWTVGASGGLRAAGAGAYGVTNSAWNASFWKVSDYAFNADQTSEITHSAPAAYDQPGAVVRWAATGGGVGYVAFFDTGNNNLLLQRFSGGSSAATLASIANTAANGDVLKLTISGTTLNVYLNGALVIGPITDANIATGQPGIFYGVGGADTARITLWTGTDAAGAGPAITSVSTGTPREGASLTITGTAFGASQGSGDVKINGVAQTVTSWSDTSIVVTIVLGTNKFGAAYTVVVRDNALTASNSYAGITGLLPANSGLSYVDIGTPNTTADYRITAVGDLASGDQLEYENVGGLVTVATDGTFAAGPGVTSFSARLWSTGVGYGTAGIQSTSGSGLPGDRRYLKLSPNIKLGW